MGETFKVEVISKELIKPSSPTSLDFKIFKLCLIDQLSPPSVYTPLLLFYSIKDTNTSNRSVQLLKSSLSKNLTFFYPLAGRIKDVTSIECNDEGVVYIQANVNYSMLELLKQPPSVEVLEQFLPQDLEESSFLFVQVNLFKCGGIAIGLRISHKIADATTLYMFLKGWTDVASSTRSNEIIIPDLTIASSILPPMDLQLSIPPAEEVGLAGKPSIRRFVFDGSKINILKANAASSNVPNPTRVEAVTAFIWKHVSKASRMSNSSRFTKLSICSNAVNLRQRIIRNSPKNAIGNLVGHYFAKSTWSEVEEKSLVSALRKGLQEFSETWLEKFQRNDGASVVLGILKDIARLQEEWDQIDLYNFSSWCKLPLYEAANFGWGKPKWIAFPKLDATLNWAMLMDTGEGDGIELWLSLKEEDMALIEHNPEFLAFVTFNPSLIK